MSAPNTGACETKLPGKTPSAHPIKSVALKLQHFPLSEIEILDLPTVHALAGRSCQMQTRSRTTEEDRVCLREIHYTPCEHTTVKEPPSALQPEPKGLRGQFEIEELLTQWLG